MQIPMTVERARGLSGGDDIVGISKFFRSEERTDAHSVAFELVSFGEMLKLQLIDVSNS